MLFQPAVEDRLRLLQQPHAARETCLLCGCQRQLLRGEVERRGHRDDDLLVIKSAIGEAVVPDAPQIFQDQSRGAHRRELLVRSDLFRAPGQDRRGVICCMMAQPGLGRAHHAAWQFRRSAAGKTADNPPLGPWHFTLQLLGKRILRQVEERGQHRDLDKRPRCFPLLDRQRLRRRIAVQRDIGERGIGGAEIDADREAGCAHGLKLRQATNA